MVTSNTNAEQPLSWNPSSNIRARLGPSTLRSYPVYTQPSIPILGVLQLGETHGDGASSVSTMTGATTVCVRTLLSPDLISWAPIERVLVLPALVTSFPPPSSFSLFFSASRFSSCCSNRFYCGQYRISSRLSAGITLFFFPYSASPRVFHIFSRTRPCFPSSFERTRSGE